MSKPSDITISLRVAVLPANTNTDPLLRNQVTPTTTLPPAANARLSLMVHVSHPCPRHAALPPYSHTPNPSPRPLPRKATGLRRPDTPLPTAGQAVASTVPARWGGAAGLPNRTWTLPTPPNALQEGCVDSTRGPERTGSQPTPTDTRFFGGGLPPTPHS